MKVIVQQKLDEQGLPDEFTCDVFPLGSGEWAEYLNSDGLPEKGTVIKTGMILVGKLGRGAAFDPDRLPTSLELHGDTPEELARKYPNYWVNMSFYATKEMEGTVDIRVATVSGIAAISGRHSEGSVTARPPSPDKAMPVESCPARAMRRAIGTVAPI